MGVACRIRLDYPVAKLMDFRGRDKELLTSSNRFALVIFAWLKARESERDHELMFAWKLELTKGLSKKTEAEQIGLIRFFDAIFPLPGQLDEQFWQTFSTSKEGKSMAYVTSLERISIRKGMEKGMEKGEELGLKKGRLEIAQENVIDVLEVRFGSVSVDVRSRVGQIDDVQTCKTLLKSAITAASIEELERYLPEN